jgi:sporulation protein YlmC with PRC-barrel domain
VIELNAAEQIGRLTDIVLDPASQCLAGLIVVQCPSWDGGGRLLIVPAAAVHALGPDAIMLRDGGERDSDLGKLAHLPRLSQVIGRPVVGDSGTVLGVLDDVQLDPRDGRILRYPLRAAHFLKRLERWLSGETATLRWDYVGADAPIHPGSAVVTVPDDAVVHLLVEASSENGASPGARGSPEPGGRGPGVGGRDWATPHRGGSGPPKQVTDRVGNPGGLAG